MQIGASDTESRRCVDGRWFEAREQLPERHGMLVADSHLGTMLEVESSGELSSSSPLRQNIVELAPGSSWQLRKIEQIHSE